jgi:transposase
MESTGVYWRPIYHRLEGLFARRVVNGQHMKAVPGRKTDVKDAEWMAGLLRHGLLRGRCMPSKPQRLLRLWHIGQELCRLRDQVDNAFIAA